MFCATPALWSQVQDFLVPHPQLQESVERVLGRLRRQHEPRDEPSSDDLAAFLDAVAACESITRTTVSAFAEKMYVTAQGFPQVPHPHADEHRSEHGLLAYFVRKTQLCHDALSASLGRGEVLDKEATAKFVFACELLHSMDEPGFDHSKLHALLRVACRRLVDVHTDHPATGHDAAAVIWHGVDALISSLGTSLVGDDMTWSTLQLLVATVVQCLDHYPEVLNASFPHQFYPLEERDAARIPKEAQVWPTPQLGWMGMVTQACGMLLRSMLLCTEERACSLEGSEVALRLLRSLCSSSEGELQGISTEDYPRFSWPPHVDGDVPSCSPSVAPLIACVFQSCMDLELPITDGDANEQHLFGAVVSAMRCFESGPQCVHCLHVQAIPLVATTEPVDDSDEEDTVDADSVWTVFKKLSGRKWTQEAVGRGQLLSWCWFNNRKGKRALTLSLASFPRSLHHVSLVWPTCYGWSEYATARGSQSGVAPLTVRRFVWCHVQRQHRRPHWRAVPQGAGDVFLHAVPSHFKFAQAKRHWMLERRGDLHGSQVDFPNCQGCWQETGHGSTCEWACRSCLESGEER